MTASAAQSAEGAAEAARQRLGLGLDGPVPDILRLLEDQAGMRIFMLELPEGGIEGAYQIDNGDPYVLLNQNRGPQKKRFTLAHEFGHHSLDHGARLDVEIKLSDRHIKEIEANYFAAAFLMPRQAVDAWFARNEDPAADLEAVVRLAYFFNVSSYVSGYRLATVGRMGATKQRSLEESLANREHYETAKALGLSWPTDTMSVKHAEGRYVPAQMEARVLSLLSKGLLSPAAAKARLHLPASSQGDQALDRLLESADAERDGDAFE